MFPEILNNVESFIFVFIRVSVIFALIPFMGGRNVPVQVKLGFAVMMALIIAPNLPYAAKMPDSLPAFAFAVFSEFFIGITLGLAARLIFTGFEMAGQLAGMQMGFSMANVMDPATSSQLSVLAQFYNILGIFLFFALNVHLVFISAIRDSFTLITPYGFSLNGGAVEGLLTLTIEIFKIAVKLAAPISVAVLLANLAMGILARTVPQLNIFVVGFPITISLGLIVLVFGIPFIASSMTNMFGDLSNNLFGFIGASAR